ncbi:hypothetical protein [Mucilaginibacter sp.]|jgi:hypothetical protein|uniref:hypothetical protein n=1 Tax=Mucilaginibacter sp. TaxID=1882438 RepID=UPI00356326C5
MKKILLVMVPLFLAIGDCYAQTTLSVDGNGVLNYSKIVTQSPFAQSFFTGHQTGTTYSYPNGIFRAWTDNSNGSANYYYDGVTNGTTNYYVRADGQGYFAGRVGIGTTSPSAVMEMTGGGVTSSIANVATTLTMRINTANPPISLGVGYVSTDNPMIQGFNSVTNTAKNIAINPFGGNVGIGTINPDALLAVAGTIHSQVVKVDMSGWSDFVFDPQYKLPALADVKAYIDRNHHLPDVPSEKEVIKNGLNVGEISKIQTKKIEELTLYLLESEKQLKQQQLQIDNQQQQIDDLRTQLKALIILSKRKE